jgi:hypothetical protein
MRSTAACPLSSARPRMHTVPARKGTAHLGYGCTRQQPAIADPTHCCHNHSGMPPPEPPPVIFAPKTAGCSPRAEASMISRRTRSAQGHRLYVTWCCKHACKAHFLSQQPHHTRRTLTHPRANQCPWIPAHTGCSTAARFGRHSCAVCTGVHVDCKLQHVPVTVCLKTHINPHL